MLTKRWIVLIAILAIKIILFKNQITTKIFFINTKI